MRFLILLPTKLGLSLAAALSLIALVLTAGCSSEHAKQTHLARGENYLKNRLYQEAAIEFRSAIEIDKTFAPAHFGLAQAYEGQERFAETIEELRKTAELEPSHIDSRLKLGNYYLLFQPPQIADAEKMVEQILAIDANNIEGHVLKASSLAVQNKPEAEVLAVLNRAISFNPQRVETYLSVGRFFMSRSNAAEAEKQFQKALQTNENAVIARLDYGRFLDFNNRAEEAEKQFRRAVEIEPNNRDAHEALAAFYVGQKKFAEAENAYKTLVNLDPNRPEERILLADFYAAINREDDAVKTLQEILTAKPEFIKGRVRLGELFLQREEVNGANEQANLILQRNGRDAAGLLLRSRIRTRQGDEETAIKDLQEVLKQEPSNKFALYYMADAQLRTGNIEQAKNFVGDLERFHPAYLYSKQLKTNIAFAEGAPPEAVKQSNELLEKLQKTRSGKNLSEKDLFDLRLGALSARGNAFLQMNKLAEARSSFGQARELAPNAPAVYLNLARVALRFNNAAEAVNYYNRALQIDGNNFDALNGLVNVRIAQKQFVDAHTLVNEKLTANGSIPHIQAALYSLQSRTYRAENKISEAENAIRQAIEKDANYLPAYFFYADLLTIQNQTDSAIAKYRTLLERNPKDANIYTLIGLLEDGRGNYDAAVQNYQKALQLNPGQAIAANNLGWLYAEHGKGNLDEAVALVQPLAEKFPNEAGYADTLGWIFHKKGANELAAAQLQRAVAIDERDAAQTERSLNSSYRMRLGAALAAKGDRANARREIEAALRNSQAMSPAEIEQAKNLLSSLSENS
jgi:tetratricopeptide (TPR) repeat protein